jgi:hypothetical protein
MSEPVTVPAYWKAEFSTRDGETSVVLTLKTVNITLSYVFGLEDFMYFHNGISTVAAAVERMLAGDENPHQ